MSLLSFSRFWLFELGFDVQGLKRIPNVVFWEGLCGEVRVVGFGVF
jgi:hypothetical protein